MDPHTLPYRVCALADVADLVASWRPGCIIAVLDPDDDLPLPAFDGPYHVLRMRDSAQPDGRAAGVVADAFALLDGLDPDTRVLFHCSAGRSRSPALALAAAARRLGASAALAWLASARPGCRPNPWILQAGDRAAQARGDLVAAFPDSFPTPR